MTLHAYVLYIPVVGYASHHTDLGRTQNMMIIVFWVYPSFQKKKSDNNYTTSRSIIEQTKSKQHGNIE